MTIKKALLLLLIGLVSWPALTFATPWVGLSPLQHAAMAGSVSELRALLQAQPDRPLTNDGLSLLHLACLSNSRDVVELLLEAGFSPSQTTPRGKSALHLAAEFNPRVDVIRLLLKHGGSLEGRDGRGRTPLMAAALHNTAAVVSELLSAGASASARDKDGRNAYQFATGEVGQPNRRLVASAVVAQLYRQRDAGSAP